MDRSVKVFLMLSIGIVLVLGLALIVISCFPLNEVQTLFDSFSPDGDFEAFSSNHIIKLRFAGIITCAVSVFLYICRRKVQQYISGMQMTDLLIQPKNIWTLVSSFIGKFKEAVKKEEKVHIYTFAIIFILAIIVRIYYLFQPMYNDESRAFTMYIYDASYGVKGVFKLLTNYLMGGHHMLYTLFAYLTYKFIGNEQSVWVIRLPALLFGILLIPASYMVMRFFYKKKTALLTSALVASSSSLIFYSNNARGHSLLCLIFLLILAMGSYLKKNDDIAGWHLFAILSAIGFYTIPIMLYPYGVVVTWLFLSILVRDTDFDRRRLLCNLCIAVGMTVLLTFLLYSPVIFFGTGLKSFAALKEAAPLSWADFAKIFPLVIQSIWMSWNKSMTFIISSLLVIGFVFSFVYHKKISVHRVPIALVAIICPLSIILLQRVIPYHTRYWLFLLIIYLGVASSGVTYLFRLVERLYNKYMTAIFISFVVILSFGLTVNKVVSEPYLDSTQMQNFDRKGKYVEFEYINAALKYYLQYEYNEDKKVLITFPSEADNDFWNMRMKLYCREFCDKYIISDMKSYLIEDSKVCHRLYVVTNTAGEELENYLKTEGVSVSDYTVPQLMHRFNFAEMYKMDRVKGCLSK